MRSEPGLTEPLRTGRGADPGPKPLLAATGVALLDVDPDLGRGIPPEEWEIARRRSVARVLEVRGSSWRAAELRADATTGWLGMYIVDGVLLRRVFAAGRAACELLGEGDLIRPWDEDGLYEPLAVDVDWAVLGDVRLAVLDGAFGARVARWPAIQAGLIQRVARRARYLTLVHAISHMPRTHSSLLLFFWLLGERWGKVAPGGVVVNLRLTHSVLAMALGCRRPSVTLALQKLSRHGLLVREGPERWLLSRQAIELLGEPQSLALLGDAT